MTTGHDQQTGNTPPRSPNEARGSAGTFLNRAAGGFAAIHRRAASLDREAVLSRVILVAAVGYNLVVLYSQAAIRVPALNDNVLHLVALQRTVLAFVAGQNPTDMWLGTIGMGYPLFHYYQHLPYLLPALAYLVLASVFRLSLPLAEIFGWTNYLVLCILPLSIYWSTRRFGFGQLTAALGAASASLLSTNGLYGFDFNSFVWSGYGLYTQLWGIVLLPPALAQGYVVLKHGRGYFLAVILLAALLLSHLVTGYIATVSLVLLALLIVLGSQSGIATRFRQVAKRLAVFLILTGLVTAYFFVPFLTDGAYMNRSVWELPTKYDSFGLQWVMTTLLTGGLFDFNRLPIFTLLVAIGLGVCLWHWRAERYRIPVVLFVAWLLLYFGRPTWGGLLNLLPMGGELQLHRLILGVHWSGIILIGIALALPWRWALHARRPAALLIPAALTILLLLPGYVERTNYFQQNARWMEQSRAAYAVEEQDVNALIETLSALPPGRVYAGLAGNWGNRYTIGAVPMYAVLQGAGLDTFGYLYHALSLNSDVQVLYNDALYEQYDLFNVRYALTPTDWTVPEFYKPVQDFGRHRLYEIETTGYFDLVRSERAFTGTKSELHPAAAAWLKSDALRRKEFPSVFFGPATGNYREVAPLAQAAAVITKPTTEPQAVEGKLVSEDIDADTYTARVNVQDEQILMLKETFHPNWHAYVDGVEVSTFMLMPSYIGVRVPPGMHNVRFTYQPQPLRGYMLFLGLLTLAVIALVEWRGEWPGLRRARAILTQPVRRIADEAANMRVRSNPSQIHLSPVETSEVSLRALLGIYLLFLSIYLLSNMGHFWSTDHVSVYLTTQSLVEHQTLAIKPIHDAAVGRDGTAYAVFGLGQSIASIPLYVVGRLVDTISSPFLKDYFGGVPLGDWGGTVPIFFVSLFNQFIAPLTCVLVFLFCLGFGFSKRASFLTTLVFGFGTAVWVSAHDYFQHPLESLLLLLSIYILFRNRTRLERRHALLAGLALGFGILTRINLLIVVPAVAVYLILIVRETAVARAAAANTPRRKDLRAHKYALETYWSQYTQPEIVSAVCLFVLPTVLALSAILCVNYAKFGIVTLTDPVHSILGFSLGNLIVALYANLFSVGRSVFLYSPPVLLGLFLFYKFFKLARREAALFLSLPLIYLLFYSLYGDWAGGWSWGPRFLVAAIPYLIIPLAFAFDDLRTLLIATALAILGVGIQILGVAVNVSYVHWEWSRMNLNPPNAYLFNPEISPISMHLDALLHGRNIDLWVIHVYDRFGLPVFLLTIALPLILLAGSIFLLRELQASTFGGEGNTRDPWNSISRRENDLQELGI